MTFTDDDLKRLKNAVAISGDTKQTFCADFKIRALLSRLEAAESKINLVLYFCKGAIRDAVESEDGLDGAAGESVVAMIEAARKGFYEGCRHCDFVRAEGFRSGQERMRERAIKEVINFTENSRSSGNEKAIAVTIRALGVEKK